MKKILFLDCDGTIRQPASGKKFIDHPLDQEAIPGAVEAIEKYINIGWTVVGVTNQGGVAAGHKSIDDAISEQLETQRLIPQISLIIFSPVYKGSRMVVVDRAQSPNEENIVFDFEPGGVGDSRKPAPGMLAYYLSDYCKDGEFEALLVGDRPEDEQAAKAAQIPFLWADQWRAKK